MDSSSKLYSFWFFWKLLIWRVVSRPGPTSDWVINHSKIACSGRKDYIDNVVFPSGFVFFSVVCLRFCCNQNHRVHSFEMTSNFRIFQIFEKPFSNFKFCFEKYVKQYLDTYIFGGKCASHSQLINSVQSSVLFPQRF